MSGWLLWSVSGQVMLLHMCFMAMRFRWCTATRRDRCTRRSTCTLCYHHCAMSKTI